MKKRILFGILFSTILTLNVISVFKTDVNDLSLMCLMQTSKAQAEVIDPCDPIFVVAIKMDSTGIVWMSCTEGGCYRCC